ncbi:MAG: M15 family metallopeptidase [Treponema sp.]|nr:M15 family metallopeptidase [Treponema sp.]
MLRKSFVIVIIVSICSIICCKKAGAAPKQKASGKETESPEVKKIDRVLSKMSERAQKEIKISDKEKFLKDLKIVLEADEKYNDGGNLSLLFLIDKTHKVGADEVPRDMIHLESNENYLVNKNNLNLRRPAYEALGVMAAAAKKDGVNLTVSSTYRSYEYQKNLFDYWVRVDGLEEAERESARPGTSQHQLGCAMDFAPVDDAFAETPGGAWVYKHAAEYGWSLSFPKNYEDITGYRWESWHFRFIGVEACKFQEKYFCDVQQYMIEFIDLWRTEK